MKLFSDNWQFLKTALGTEYADISNRFEEFQTVDIPHDWLIYDSHNLYEDSTGWYIKKFDRASLSCKTGERALLVFDGVYMDSTVYVNGQKVGDWKYGYSTFFFDITDNLLEGENLLAVQVRFQAPNSRWYSGAGIYRNVWLHIYPENYLPLDGTYVHTVYEENCYLLDIETEVGGRAVDEMASETDAAEKKQISCHYTLWQGESLCRDLGWSKEVVIRDSVAKTFLKAKVTDVCEWNLEDSQCYELRVELHQDDEKPPVDVQRITIGFRRMEFKPDSGFYLNGKIIKVHGVCEHHDLGCLGAAFHKEAMRRKLVILKKMGVNALRTSHNMPAREVMELADEMGILVLSEAFDMWERSKTPYDYGRFFKEWAERDVEVWIRRDRNHPSLFLWSIGNEIYDTHADAHGEEITHRLVDYVRRHDIKGNAPITIGSNYMPWEGAQKCADIVKFAGYNYAEKYYEEHHKEHPDWVIYGSETASTVQSRGVYRFPLSQPMLADEDEQCSALGNSSTSWGAKSTEACIIADRDAEFAFGQFIWTGFDYIGEPTPYHTKNSYLGQVDTAGFAKDSYYVYQAEWTDAAKAPMVHVFPYWDFNPGQRIDVRACTNGAAVELFVNGKSLGRQEIDHAHGTSLLGNWRTEYVPGEIEAVAYDASGNVIAREKRHSFGDGVRLTISADKEQLLGDGEDLCFLTIGVEDKDGYPVENAMDYVELVLSGNGRLLGMDNGDSTDYDSYKGNVRKLFNGKLLAVVASDGNSGEINITVQNPYLESAYITIPVVEAPVRDGIRIRENVAGRAKMDTTVVPVRKVEIRAAEGQLLTPECRTILLEAQIFPENATDKSIIWKVVNQNGIEINYAKIEVEDNDHGVNRARLTAYGDGEFLVRCISKSGTGKIRIISQLEFTAQGLGEAFLNPYEFVSAGFYDSTIGEIGNGNEKGIATARDGLSGAVYKGLDFGDYGSDEITLWVFALSDAPHPIEIWQGIPEEEGSELLMTAVYQKPSIWNTYQEETWKLPKRIKGLATIAFRLKQKAHIKGFSFLKCEKAFGRIEAAECTQVYGDSFLVEEKAITGIGNNVTICYDNMNFGEKGAVGIYICGRTKLPGNTIHLHLVTADGQLQNRILEVNGTKEYTEQYISFETLQGEGTIEFIFLPGSDFDMEYFRFE